MPRRAQDELPILTGRYDLLAWIVPVIDRMPRARKFTIGERLESKLLDALVHAVVASYAHEKSALRAPGKP